MEHASLTKEIIGSGMKVHGVLGPGFVEVVYRNALAYELHKHGLSFERERHLTVHYDGIIVGDFSADFLVEGLVLIEVKATRAIVPRDEAQLINYLTAIELEVGLLMNFGTPRLEFKRKTRTYRRRPNSRGQDGQDGQDVQDAIEEMARVL